jgi:hypothetical protein
MDKMPSARMTRSFSLQISVEHVVFILNQCSPTFTTRAVKRSTGKQRLTYASLLYKVESRMTVRTPCDRLSILHLSWCIPPLRRSGYAGPFCYLPRVLMLHSSTRSLQLFLTLQTVLHVIERFFHQCRLLHAVEMPNSSKPLLKSAKTWGLVIIRVDIAVFKY